MGAASNLRLWCLAQPVPGGIAASWYGVMKLTFFVAACTVLGFASVAKTVLVTHQQCLHSVKAFSCSPHSKVSRLGMRRGWVGTQSIQLTQTDQRDIPYHMTLCSAIKAGITPPLSPLGLRCLAFLHRFWHTLT